MINTEWKIPSFTKRNVVHTVKCDGHNLYRCSCQDFKMNGNPNCKHIRLVTRKNDYMMAVAYNEVGGI
jgi:hypothetical protein